MSKQSGSGVKGEINRLIALVLEATFLTTEQKVAIVKALLG